MALPLLAALGGRLAAGVATRAGASALTTSAARVGGQVAGGVAQVNLMRPEPVRPQPPLHPQQFGGFDGP